GSSGGKTHRFVREKRQGFDLGPAFRRTHAPERRRRQPGGHPGVCLGDRRVLGAYSCNFVALTLANKLVNLAIPRCCPRHPVVPYRPTVYLSPSLFSPPFGCPLAALASARAWLQNPSSGPQLKRTKCRASWSMA